ncbi:MAG: chromophore lyase CpcT/CpeT [Bacteroidia bacterium]|nr:chromophore lyase CpcT/CpeT [Bacteroidia bacterium]MBP6649663.1 chromophore lyase CpcT/CpeT [Bacteroidia bacterium]
MQHFVISLCLILFLSSSNTVHAQSTELKSLAQWMEGSYSSQNQHLKDTANYFDIRLQIIPIWKDKKDGYWFYVEQAVADYIDKPYRQRVYHLKENEKGVFESVVLTLKDPLRFTHKPEEIEKLITDSLTEKEGCSVILSKKDEFTFVGETQGKMCPSDRKGAAYATSEVTITENELISWDRGYNDKDEQVWGAEKGGYHFLKIRKED